jgi:CDP-diacylglycerol--glycerol-3-phosphate 3-phosphatidyltransferase
MNLPNKLTILRVIMIPFFLIFLYIPGFFGKWMALTIFILAAITDTLDGQIARRYNLVTNFGKFMDPLADKLLVCSALIALVDKDRIPAWIVIIIIAREFIISGFRLIAAEKGTVIAAGMWGKLKTVVQMVMVCFLIANIGGVIIHIIEQILIYLSLVLTLISLADYLISNKDVLAD